MNYRLISYVRDKNNIPQAAFVAIPVSDNGYSIGVSQCNDKDAFNKKRGILIATSRAEMNVGYKDILSNPWSYQKISDDNMAFFLDKCKRYYKGRQLV